GRASSTPSTVFRVRASPTGTSTSGSPLGAFEARPTATPSTSSSCTPFSAGTAATGSRATSEIARPRGQARVTRASRTPGTSSTAERRPIVSRRGSGIPATSSITASTSPSLTTVPAPVTTTCSGSRASTGLPRRSQPRPHSTAATPADQPMRRHSRARWARARSAKRAAEPVETRGVRRGETTTGVATRPRPASASPGEETVLAEGTLGEETGEREERAAEGVEGRAGPLAGDGDAPAVGTLPGADAFSLPPLLEAEPPAGSWGVTRRGAGGRLAGPTGLLGRGAGGRAGLTPAPRSPRAPR